MQATKKLLLLLLSLSLWLLWLWLLLWMLSSPSSPCVWWFWWSHIFQKQKKRVKWRRGVRSRGSTTQPPTAGKHGATVKTPKSNVTVERSQKKIAFLKHGATMRNSKIFGAIWKSHEKHNFPQRRQDFEAFRLFVIPCRMWSHHISKCLRTSGTRQGEPSCDSSFKLRL